MNIEDTLASLRTEIPGGTTQAIRLAPSDSRNA